MEVELIVSHMHRVGFEPTQLTLPGLKSGSLDHSDMDAFNFFLFFSLLDCMVNSKFICCDNPI